MTGMQTITAQLLDELSAQAADRARRRANHNLHASLDDPTQRLLNAMEPGTYVPPHRHLDPARWEVFVCLRGAAAVLTFDDSGAVTEQVVIRPGGPEIAVEIDAGTWHTIAPLEAGSVFFELKPGPYAPLTDKDFAPWAPPEGEKGIAELVRWFETAQPGDTYEPLHSYR
jgi:cupin fold WbuC family metalloprotein